MNYDIVLEGYLLLKESFNIYQGIVIAFQEKVREFNI